ncbi:MAG: toll/interleukin-1 receptor domain-containing protein [Rubrivivax sp.]|nr:toll/interleukin-1 receptor domain-containing protein [Pyrinomonadaceae bacterium]
MRDQIFISYSHSDRKWLGMLKDHLEPYVDAESLAYWDDSKIKAGDDWFGEIQRALAAAKVAVLLVSPKFLSSQFIRREELPPLLAAAQDEGLRIIWIAISKSSYDKTWLGKYQAANDPNEPLRKFEQWKRDEVLVDVCKKIAEALGPRPEPVWLLPDQARRKAPDEIIRCNRSHYLNRFASFFGSNLKSRPSLPHVYLIHGKLGECHNTFVKRIYQEVIKPVADKELAHSQGQGILPKKTDLDWPAPSEGSESRKKETLRQQQEDLQLQLNMEFAGGFNPDFPAATFAELMSKYRFVIVQHTAILSRWADFSKDLINWYLNTYWATLAQAEAPRGGSRPQFLIFIKIKYPEQGILESLLPSPTVDPKENVKRDLQGITGKANKLYPCLLLDELRPPPYTEVYKWYTENNIYDNERDRIDAAIKMYKKYGEKIAMADIEKELGQHYQV